MKNIKPFVLLAVLFILYWILVYLITYIVGLYYPAGGESILRAMLIAIKLCPLIGIVIISMLCFLYKEWYSRCKIIIFLLLIVQIIFLFLALFSK